MALVLLLTVAALVGCGSSNKVTLTVGDIDADTNVNSITSAQLREIANVLASVYAVDFDTQEMLVAASRGYDLTADGVTGNEEAEYPDLGVNVQAAKNVIAKASEKAIAQKLNGVESAVYANLNEADVQVLVKAFQTTPSTAKDNGPWDAILSAIGTVLNWITNTLCFGSYFVGICLFAVLIEICMLPFAIKQQKNSIKQAKLRPKEMAIRNKYKGRNDQKTMQKMQQEIQEFYQRENFSPYSGCLQLVIQMPIILALYNIIIDPLHYVLGQSSAMAGVLNTFASTSRAAGGLGLSMSGSNGTIALLSELKAGMLEGLQNFAFFSNGTDLFNAVNPIMDSLPNFNIGPFNFGLLPSFSRFDILLLVPVLTFATYFITSKLNRKFMYQPTANEGADARQVACSNNIMDITMPAMSTVFTFAVPGLVGVYWMFRSLVNLLKQFIISKIMPLPTFTEEDYKAAAREMAGKKVVKKSENVGKVRSLHHIDDEDYDDTRECALARKAAIEEREREEQQKKAEKSEKLSFGGAALKEERKNKKQNPKAEDAAEAEDASANGEETENNDMQNNIQE